jgi:hypothetical protein
MDVVKLVNPSPLAIPGTALAPQPSRTTWRSELLGHGIAIALTMILLVGGQRLDLADWHAPFDYDNMAAYITDTYDAMLILPLVKATVERGSHWRNERLGAPGIQETHDFAVIDHLHFGIIWILARFFSDAVVVFNLFHVLTYPLTTLTALFVLRRFGISMPVAILGAILYSFQPYHYIRGLHHYFLAAYFIVPLTLMVIFWICQGRLPFFAKEADGQYRFRLWRRDNLETVLIAAATASAGAYYAYFACAILVAAGCYSWFYTKTVRGMMSAFAVIGLIVFGGIMNHLPMFVYQAEYGKNARPMQRLAEEAEIYASRISQFVLPVPAHNPVGIGNQIWFDPAAIRSEYQAPLFKPLNESDGNAFGFIGSIGFLALLALALFPKNRGWPLGALSSLTVFCTLLATVGSLGALFNLLISAQVRCYNRVSIYMVFIALFAVCWGLDRLFLRRGGVKIWARWLVCLGLLAIGIWDQTNDAWFPDLRIQHPDYVSVVDIRRKNAERYWEDRAFFERVEAILPEGMIFTYPYMEFPESMPYREPGSPGVTQSYDMSIGYLHTSNLRWSYGTMKGREWDLWMRDVAGKWANTPRFLERLVLAGFEGLLIDARSIRPDRFQRFKSGIEQYIGHGALREVHPTRKYYFFDLREHRDWLRKNMGEAHFEAMAKNEREMLMLLFLKGLSTFDMLESKERTYWGQPKAEILFVNRSSETVTATYEMQLRTSYFEGSAWLRIRGGDIWTEDVEIFPEADAPTITRTFTVPPGRHSVKITCEPTLSVLPSDSRNILYAIAHLRRIDRE